MDFKRQNVIKNPAKNKKKTRKKLAKDFLFLEIDMNVDILTYNHNIYTF